MTTRISSRGRVGSAGFTLLELLIGIAVGAVVLVVIQTTFFGALRLHNTTHARIDEDLVLTRALGIIRQDFAGILLPGGTLSGQLQSTTFSSTSTGTTPGDRVTPDLFTSSGKVDGWNPFSEVQKISYTLAASSDPRAGRDLIRVVTRNLLPVQEALPEEQIILPGVQSASVEFYDGAGWTDTWDSEATTSLPTAIKLVLAMADSPAQSSAPIELIVPIWPVTTQQARAAEATP